MIDKFYTFLKDVRPYLFHDRLSLASLFLKFLNPLILFSLSTSFSLSFCLCDAVCVVGLDLCSAMATTQFSFTYTVCLIYLIFKIFIIYISLNLIWLCFKSFRTNTQSPQNILNSLTPSSLCIFWFS